MLMPPQYRCPCCSFTVILVEELPDAVCPLCGHDGFERVIGAERPHEEPAQPLSDRIHSVRT